MGFLVSLLRDFALIFNSGTLIKEDLLLPDGTSVPKISANSANSLLSIVVRSFMLEPFC